MSEDENSASNSEDGDDSNVSYQSIEDEYQQQLTELEFSDSGDDSKHSSNESVHSNRSNMQHQLSATDKGFKISISISSQKQFINLRLRF